MNLPTLIAHTIKNNAKNWTRFAIVTKILINFKKKKVFKQLLFEMRNENRKLNLFNF